MVMKAYTIVEFENGVEMVPTIWLSEDNKLCIWPDTKEQIRINNMIALKETPDTNNKSKWSTYDVLRIFGSADTYESGKEKLKLAEQISDIGSDTGAEDTRAIKKSRHFRASRKFYSSDEEGSETNYPEIPATFSQMARGRQSLKSSVIDKAEARSKDGKFSPKKSHISDQHQKNSREDEMSTDIISKNKRETLINDDGTDPILNKQPNESRENGRKSGATLKIAIRQQSDCTLSRAGTQNDNKRPEIEMSIQSRATKSLSFAERQTSERTVTVEQVYDILKEVCLKLSLLKSKMTTVEVAIRDIREIVSSGQSRPICDADLDDHGLPFNTSEAFKVFEKELLVSDVRQSMVKTLKLIGGFDVQSITSNILAKIMHNRLAEEYSFKGHKGKIPFKELFNVVNLIKNVVRTHKPQVTDKDIEEAIGSWLSQAKTRRLREEAKKARREAEEEAIRSRVHEDVDL